VFENRVSRKTFEPKREKVRGGWRKLNIEELHSSHFHHMLLEPEGRDHLGVLGIG
jgi:hypothetical protein